ncbi:methyltransferase domain protein [Ceratobasidium sp. AG-Ba]|nr:methyltransferase domain protein [Ceratobasidium sp. AG-Ba]
MAQTVESHPVSVRVRQGRQFHDADSNYPLPNDIEEHHRLTSQHEAIKLIVGANYTAPLPQLNDGTGPKSILDIGTGSGQWVIDISNEFPMAKAVGIDLSEPSIDKSTIPERVSFVVGDIVKALPFESASFDVVHMRMLPSFQHRAMLYKEVHRILRPGGIIQLVEPGEFASRVDPNMPELAAFQAAIIKSRHVQAARAPTSDEDAAPAAKKTWSMAYTITDDLKDAPRLWTSVNDEWIHMPIGVWSDDEAGQKAGKYFQQCTVGLAKGLGITFVDDGILTEEEVNKIVAGLETRMEEGKKSQIEWPFCYAWARKL